MKKPCTDHGQESGTRRCNRRYPSLLLLGLAIGCGQTPDYRDQRLAEFAERSTAEQAQQNARLAEVVQQTAKSRQELIQAHQALASQLNQQQTVIDAGRQQLEQDRREIAEQRHRNPIIAAALQSALGLLACLLPRCW